jgi:hypothetical protein
MHTSCLGDDGVHVLENRLLKTTYQRGKKPFVALTIIFITSHYLEIRFLVLKSSILPFSIPFHLINVLEHREERAFTLFIRSIENGSTEREAKGQRIDSLISPSGKGLFRSPIKGCFSEIKSL